MRLIAVDSTYGATLNKGHPEHFLAGLSRFASQRSVPLQVICHKNDLSDVLPSNLRTPIISHSAHQSLSNDPFDGRLIDFTTGEQRLCADLISNEIDLVDGDLLFLPTATSRELAGIASWVERLGARVHIAALFHWGTHRVYQRGGLEAALLRQAGRKMSATEPMSMWMAATQEDLARGLSGPLGCEVATYPSATFFDAIPKRTGSKDGVNIGFIGGMRNEKGGPLLPYIVALAATLAPSFNFIVQCHSGFEDNAALDEMARLHNCTLVRDWLDADSMLNLCSTLDVAILPYDRRFYASAVSGVFTYLSGIGIPCLVPSSTWMSNRIASEDAAGHVYEGTSAEDILTALMRMSAELIPLRQQADRKAAGWQRNYSATSLLEDLFRAVGQE